MKFEEYALATINPIKYTILGLTMKPLSLSHYLNMKCYGCDYASDDASDVSVYDLIVGVLICSMTSTEWKEFSESPNLYKEIRKWGRKVGKQAKKDKSFNIYDKMRLFKSYIETGTRMPRVEFTSNPQDKYGVAKNRSSVSHWSLHLNTTLVSKLGFTQDEALNMPLVQAFAHFFQHMENEGVLRIVPSPDDQYNMFLEMIKSLKKEVNDTNTQSKCSS